MGYRYFSKLTQLAVAFLLLIGAQAFSVASASSKSLPTGLTVSTTVDSSIVGAPSGMMINVTAKNESNSVVSFSRRGTILDIGLEEDYFNVASNGVSMVFSPIHMKRPKETDAEKVVLAPGQSVTNSIPLAPYYGVVEKGLYSLSLKSAVPFGFGGKKNVHQVNVLGSLEDSSLIQGKRTFAHRLCSTTQVNQLDDAVDQANLIARAAINDLNNTSAGLRSSAARYREWFGAFSASRYNQVTSNFTAIDNALTNQQISIDCGCTAIAPDQRNNLFAYVFPNQPFVVNLCGAFWRAPLTGTDSRAGVIVHEVSHFTVVSGTIDNAVGVTAAKNLARSNPSASILNADNHEYFAENSPKLRMSSKDSSCEIADTNSVSAIQQPAAITFPGNPLSQAVDDLSHNYITESPSFFATTSASTRGGDSARSANIGDDQASAMITQVIGPGTVSFDWRVSSEVDFDFFAFGVLNANGGVVGTPAGISGNVGFTRRTFSFPAGEHFLVWVYEKDFSISSGLDAGYVDNVRITEQTSGAFASSNSRVTNILCSFGSAPMAPIINLILDEESSTP